MKIVFFYPSYVVGGAEYLFVRLAEYLSCNHECYIVDYSDGIYRKLCKSDTKVNFIKYKENFNLPPDSYILTYPNTMYQLLNNRSIMQEEYKIIFWAVHPDNFQTLIFTKKIFPGYFIKKIFYKLIQQTINALINKRSLVIMDGGIIQRYNELYAMPKNLTYDFCPIPVIVEDNLKYMKKVNSVIKCVWLGRLSEEKVFSLLKVIEDINNNITKEVEFDIIGEGKFKKLLYNLKLNSNIKLNFLGTITNNLDSILLNYDILFGMGTSVLEGAKLGIPSILVDPSYDSLPSDYLYKWIFDTDDFVLGCFLPNPYSDKNTLTMNDIFANITDLEKKRYISGKCYEYVLENHSLSNIANKIVEALKITNLRMNDIKELPICKIYPKRLRNLYRIIKKG